MSSLIGGSRWVANGDTTSLTFSFPTSADNWANPYTTTNEPFTGGVRALDPAAANAVRATLGIWSRYANIEFTETSDNATNVGDIRIAISPGSDVDAAAHAYLPTSNPAGGDIWFDGEAPNRRFEPGYSGFFLLLHEIGHALGLKHPFETSPINQQILDRDLDSINFTVMSYNIYPDVPYTTHAFSYFPTTPMELDIAAIQYLYGAKPFNAGDTEYVYNQGSQYFETIYDTGGNDTIVWNASTEAGIIDLLGGEWSAVGDPLITVNRAGEVIETDYYTVAIFSESVIENAIGGGGDDLILGNDVANRLDGGDGHDNIFGYDGTDTLIGGNGNDHLYGRSASGGADGEDSLSGGAGGDYLQGNAGNDVLDGGDGSDRVNGGGGDDRIFGGEGNDTVNGNLGADTISGGDGNDSLRGGQGSDSISGGGGNDLLSGDLGADTLSGGGGIDIFLFSGAGSSQSQPDWIVDFNDGIDRISIGFTPSAILIGPNQFGTNAAAGTAQQLLDGREGNGEVAVLSVGNDTYLFYASNGGATVDSAILVVGIGADSFSLADFA